MAEPTSWTMQGPGQLAGLAEALNEAFRIVEPEVRMRHQRAQVALQVMSNLLETLTILGNNPLHQGHAATAVIDAAGSNHARWLSDVTTAAAAGDDWPTLRALTECDETHPDIRVIMEGIEASGLAGYESLYRELVRRAATLPETELAMMAATAVADSIIAGGDATRADFDTLRLGMNVMHHMNPEERERVMAVFISLNVREDMFEPDRDLPIIGRAFNIANQAVRNPVWEGIMLDGAAAAYRAGMQDTATFFRGILGDYR